MVASPVSGWQSLWGGWGFHIRITGFGVAVAMGEYPGFFKCHFGSPTLGETLLMCGISIKVHDTVQQLDDLNRESSMALRNWTGRPLVDLVDRDDDDDGGGDDDGDGDDDNDKNTRELNALQQARLSAGCRASHYRVIGAPPKKRMAAEAAAFLAECRSAREEPRTNNSHTRLLEASGVPTCAGALFVVCTCTTR